MRLDFRSGHTHILLPIIGANFHYHINSVAGEVAGSPRRFPEARIDIPFSAGKMKSVVILFGALLVFHVAEGFDLDFLEIMTECAKDLGMSPDTLKEMMANKSDKLGCVNACVMNKIGAMENGELKIDNLQALLEANKASIPDYPKIKEAVDTCGAEASAISNLPECELAGRFGMCMQNHM